MIEQVKKLIENGILARPQNDMSFKIQTKILKEKGYTGEIIYQTYANKIISIKKDGTVEVYFHPNQMIERYENLIRKGGE